MNAEEAIKITKESNFLIDAVASLRKRIDVCIQDAASRKLDHIQFVIDAGPMDVHKDSIEIIRSIISDDLIRDGFEVANCRKTAKSPCQSGAINISWKETNPKNMVTIEWHPIVNGLVILSESIVNSCRTLQQAKLVIRDHMAVPFPSMIECKCCSPAKDIVTKKLYGIPYTASTIIQKLKAKNIHICIPPQLDAAFTKKHCYQGNDYKEKYQFMVKLLDLADEYGIQFYEYACEIIRNDVHPYLCFQHGGSEACEKANKENGLKCPKCELAEIHKTIPNRR